MRSYPAQRANSNPISWTIRRFRRVLLGLFLAMFFGGSLVFAMAFVRETQMTVKAWNDVASRPLSESVGAIIPGGPADPGGPVWSGSERVNILLLGVDMREGYRESDARTDSMLVLSFDPQTKQTGILSLPRDLWVTIPLGGNRGFTEDRINTTFVYAGSVRYPGGGPALAKQTVSYNLNEPIHFVAWVDFHGFTSVVDRLGGLTVDVAAPVKDNEYPTEDYGIQRIYFPPGLQRLNGEQALIYARTRHQDSDIFRANRQQQILLAARQQALTLNLLPVLPALIDDFRDTVKTDMSPAQILALARLAVDADTANMIVRTAPSYNFTTSQGASIQMIDRSQLRQVVEEVFQGKREDVPNTVTPR